MKQSSNADSQPQVSESSHSELATVDPPIAPASSPLEKVQGALGFMGDRLKQVLPVNRVAQTVIQWFTVNETQIAEILETVRSELPTTEALLLGKPQAGKSSIVRGLTGVSAEIVGQGFRPHTQYTQRYAYPTDDLPLLIFTDTVGLGDVTQNTQTLIQDLTQELEEKASRARILILTVKITDFATDTLRQIAQQLRQQHPEIPCLLAEIGRAHV